MIEVVGAVIACICAIGAVSCAVAAWRGRRATAGYLAEATAHRQRAEQALRDVRGRS